MSLKLPRRKFLHLAAGAAALPTLSCPSRPSGAAARRLHDGHARSDERLVQRARRTPHTGGGP